MGREPGCVKRVILTRSPEDIEKDRGLFEKFGFEVIPLPLIETQPIDFEAPPEAPDIVVFQSAKAVRYFLSRAGVGEARVYAVGDKTARALKEKGVKVFKVASESNALGLLREFPEGRGELVLVPRSEQGREELIVGLREKGYRVHPLNVYRTVEVSHEPESFRSVVEGGGFLVFASPSAVRSFFANMQRSGIEALQSNLVVVAIGKTTKKELEKFGVVPKVIPAKPLMEEVAGKIHEFWQENCLA